MYTVTIEKYGHKAGVIETASFDNKKDANKAKRELSKKYDLQKHAGHTVNYSTFLELFTNY
jgi:hypothetical protein